MKIESLTLALALLLAGCGQDKHSAWLGYAEGDNAFVSAPQAGWVTSVAVKRGGWVKEGDLLFTLDDPSQTAARDAAVAAIAEAEGQMGQAEANLELASKQLVRQQGLLRANATSKQSYDLAKSAYDSAAAQVDQIKAAENQAAPPSPTAPISLLSARSWRAPPDACRTSISARANSPRR